MIRDGSRANALGRALELQQGHSLLEVMLVVVLIGAAASQAAPAFTSVIQKERVARVGNRLLTAMHIARTEALKTNRVVVVCPIHPTLDACVAGSDWSNGWLVFRDPDGDDQPDGDETILQVGRLQADAGQVRLEAGDATDLVHARADGSVVVSDDLSPPSWVMCPRSMDSESSLAAVRGLRVSVLGRAELVAGGELSPAEVAACS